MASSCQAPVLDDTVIRAAPGARNAGSQRAGSGPCAVDQPLHALELARAPEITASSASKPLRSSWHTTLWWPCLTRNVREPGSSCSLMQPELALGEPEALRCTPRHSHRRSGKNILVGVCSMMRAADGTVQHVARALRRQAHDPIQLAPGLRAVLGEALERGIGQQAPELVHPAHEAAAIEQLANEMEEVQRDRRTRHLVIEEVGDVEPDHGAVLSSADSTESVGVVEHPGVVAPACARTSARGAHAGLRIGRIQELDQPRQPPRRRLERQRAAQRLIEIGALARRRGRSPAGRTSSRSQAFRNSTLCARCRQLQRIEAGRRRRSRAADTPRPARAPGSQVRDPCRTRPASRPVA